MQLKVPTTKKGVQTRHTCMRQQSLGFDDVVEGIITWKRCDGKTKALRTHPWYFIS